MAYRAFRHAVRREFVKTMKKEMNYRRIKSDAKSRSESKKVETPFGTFWMSPIEFQLYEAMRDEGLSPRPQFYIEGYFVDFAFPDVNLAIEADGVEFHSGDRRQRDQKRDWVIRRAGWTVKRFKGTTIYDRASNCAFVIKREVEERRMQERERERQRKIKRQKQMEAIARPFKKGAKFLRRKKED